MPHMRLRLVAPLAAAFALAKSAWPQDKSDPKRQKKLAAGESEAKKLLLLMDRDKSGKVSKEEFMSFMEAEFNRLDKDKNGELDVEELTHSQFRTNVGAHLSR